MNLLASKVSDSHEKLKSFIQKRGNLSAHIINLPRVLVEKNNKIEELKKELQKKRNEKQDCGKNEPIARKYADVYMENQEFKSKIKDLKQEHYCYTLQILEALEMVKVKVLEENGEKKKKTVEKNEKNKEEKEFLKKKEDGIRNELEETYGDLQRYRGRKENFEQLMAENEHPDSRPCKCVIC